MNAKTLAALPVHIRKTIKAYTAAGRIVHVYPRKGTMSLNGSAQIIYGLALARMLDAIRADKEKLMRSALSLVMRDEAFALMHNEVREAVILAGEAR